jgi:Domain of unknown function (DUF4136)
MMRARLWLAVASAVALSGCGPDIRVSTDVAPNATFATLHSFHVMTPPARRTGLAAPTDPMLMNSISNKVLRTSIEAAFASRGYASETGSADFDVAYYASARERLDVSLWDYGYPGRWGGWYPRPEYIAAPYTQGTVIVDVIDPKTKELLWRGRGVAATSDDPGEFQRNLASTVKAIVAEFPAAKAHVGGLN